MYQTYGGNNTHLSVNLDLDSVYHCERSSLPDRDRGCPRFSEQQLQINTGTPIFLCKKVNLRVNTRTNPPKSFTTIMNGSIRESHISRYHVSLMQQEDLSDKR